MDSHSSSRVGSADEGLATVGFVLAVALSLLIFTGLANVIVVQYARGVVRSALDEAVRDGSRADASVDVCLATAATWLDDLLGGSLGEGVDIACDLRGEEIVASADLRFESWFPGIADWGFSMEAVMLKESS